MPLACTPWSDEKVEELKRLWAEGLSGTDIAKALGAEFTRCAVLGKVMRLGLQPRKSAEFKPGPPPAARGFLRRAVFPRSGSSPGRGRGQGAGKEKRVLQPVEPEPVPSRPRRLPLLELADDHCRWPIGDPRGKRFYFCAADRADGVPYCPFHMTRAFAKPRGFR